MDQRRFGRVFGYARVSSVEQSLGTSLQDQQAAMSAHAEKHGLKVTRCYTEAESGIHEKIEKREQMTALLGQAREGDLILCDKIDRWSRDPEVTYRTMRELREKGVAVYFVGDACDPSTPHGDTMLNFRVLFAKEEHKRIKLRLVGTRKLLRDRGLYVEGLPPWGYRRQSEKTGPNRVERNILVVEATEAALIRRVFKFCIAGKAISEIMSILDLGKDRVVDALHRRLYTGEIQDARGEWIKGKHEAIIDAWTFNAAQEALSSRLNRSRAPTEGGETSTWWLRDVARCLLCGARMSAAYGSRNAEGRNYYYACAHRKNCTTKFVAVRAVEEACDPLVCDRLIELRDELAKPPRVIELGPRLDLKERRQKLDRKREKYLEMHADGLTTREEVRVQLEKIDRERMKLDAAAAERPAPAPAARREVLRDVEMLSKAWRKLRPEKRRTVMNTIAVSVGMAAGKPPSPVWKSAHELAGAKA